MSRRDFLSAGLITGSATVVVPTVAGLLASRGGARRCAGRPAGIGSGGCGITGGAGKIPFICFDLSGGANIAGSNVLIGKQGGQLDFLTTAGYSKLGIPGNMTPNLPTFTDSTFGLAFHSDSAFLNTWAASDRSRRPIGRSLQTCSGPVQIPGCAASSATRLRPP